MVPPLTSAPYNTIYEILFIPMNKTYLLYGKINYYISDIRTFRFSLPSAFPH